MKRFVIRSLLFVLILMVGCLLFRYILMPEVAPAPYYWGDNLIEFKRKDLLSLKPPINTLFLGSSMVYRQIIPSVFDSVINHHTFWQLHSYNFGVNWLASSELIYLTQHLMKEFQPAPRYVFFELQRIKMVDYANYFTTRITYWYTPSLYLFTVKAIRDSRMPLYAKIGQLLSHTINFIGNQINLGYLTEYFRFRSGRKNRKEEFFPPSVNRGFISLEEENRQKVRAGLMDSARIKNFLKDTTVITARKEARLRIKREMQQHAERFVYYNKTYSDKLKSMIEELKQQGSHLIVFIPPRLDRLQYDELFPILNSLPEAHRLDMSDAEKFPEFYLSSHSYDMTHLNASGAQLYSVALAREFIRLKTMYAIK
jgi:hypothetical protein